MTSPKKVDDYLDLDGFRASRTEAEVLQRLRFTPMSYEQYFEFLRSQPDLTAEELRRRPGARGRPFKLDR